ncbi:MAG: hypothetical protein ACK5HT_10390, partial [Draconibacterium sp.]
MKTTVIQFFLLIFLITSCSVEKGEQFQLEKWTMTISNKGKIIELKDNSTSMNHLLPERESWLLTLKQDTVILKPQQASFQKDKQALTLNFENNISVQVNIQPKKDHLTFEVASISSEDGIDALIWGPYYTDLNTSIGEVVGIVQGGEFTLGLQALNQKTLGGYPWTDDDFLPQLDIFSQSDSENMEKEEGTPYTLYS